MMNLEHLRFVLRLDRLLAFLTVLGFSIFRGRLRIEKFNLLPARRIARSLTEVVYHRVDRW
jgi:hypothetical protein